MGNLTYLIPTESKDQFNSDSLTQLLKKEFKNLTIQSEEEGMVTVLSEGFEVSIIVFSDDGDFKPKDVIKDLQNDIGSKIEDEQTKNDYKVLIEDMKKVEDNILSPQLYMTYPSPIYFNKRRQVRDFIKEKFNAYIFDDGFYPEFLRPEEKGWIGIDADIQESLFEYGVIAKYDESQNEWFVIYSVGDGTYSNGSATEEELNNIIEGEEWAKEDVINSFLDTMGMSKEEWLKLNFIQKLHDIIQYWGHMNIFGTPYGNMTQEELIEEYPFLK